MSRRKDPKNLLAGSWKRGLFNPKLKFAKFLAHVVRQSREFGEKA
jgi:hypothetical protein